MSMDNAHQHHAPALTFHIDLGNSGDEALRYPSEVQAMIDGVLTEQAKNEPDGYVEGDDRPWYGSDTNGTLTDPWGREVGYWEVK